jgi:dihydrofolate reductase
MEAFIIAAISLDGFISPLESTSSMNWTSGADKEFFKERTKKAGVIVMGRTTFDTIGKALPGRRNIVYTSKPFDETNQPEGVETTTLSPGDLLAQLESEGHTEVAICGGSSIYSLFMRENCVSKLYITVESILFGEGIPLFKDIPEQKLALVSTTPLGGNAILLEYSVGQSEN